MAAYGILFHLANAQPLSRYGTVQPGSYWLFYTSGGLVQANVYADGLFSSVLSQVPGAAQPSCTADAYGRFNPIYLDPSVIYKAQLFNASGQRLEAVDPIVEAASFASLAGFSGSGTMNLTDTTNSVVVPFRWFLSAGNEMCTLQVGAGTITSAQLTLSLQINSGADWPPMVEGEFETGDSYHQIPALNNSAYITGAARMGLGSSITLMADPTVGAFSWTPSGTKGLPVGFTLTYPIRGISDGP